MANQLAVIGVTRPDSFNPDNDYTEIIARGDEWLSDFDVNDLIKILRFDLALILKFLVVEGAILAEGGGIIGDPVVGVGLGGDTLASGGVYRGFETQLYTVQILTPGPAGTATYAWKSQGSDNPNIAGTAFPITAIAPSLGAARAEPEKYAHLVGTLGLEVYFINPTGAALNASSWAVLATARAQAPIVTKGSPDVGHDQIRCFDCVTIIQSAPRRIREATLTFAAATTGITTIYGEWTRRIVTDAEDPTLVVPANPLKDRFSDTPCAYRMQERVVYRDHDTSDVALGPDEVDRRIFPLYAWDRATDVVTKVQARAYAIDINQTQGALDAQRLLNVDQNILLRGTLARRDRFAHGSYVGSPLQKDGARAALSGNTAPAGKRRIAVAPSTVFVEGLEITHPDPFELDIDLATEFQTVLGEQHTYDSLAVAAGGFYLSKAVGEQVFPIGHIAQLRAHVQVGTGSGGSGSGYEVLTRGSDDTLNNLNPVDPDSWIVSSAAGGGGTVYAKGTGSGQWQLGGQQITWAGGGGPANAAPYYVRYKYNRVMVENTDFVLNADGFVSFAPAGVDPVASGIVTVDYTAYLPRVDAILVRPSGDYYWVKGIAAEEPLLPALPPLTCPYVRIELGAGPGGAIRLVPFDNDAVHMDTLNRVVRAVRELVENDLYQDIHNQLRDGTTGNPIDILAEAFATFDVADQAYDNGAGIAFSALVDVSAGELTLPFTTGLYTPARETANLPSGETAVRIGADFYTLPFADELAITNDAYSRPFPVNPFDDFATEDPEFVLTPDSDVFVDVSTQSVNDVAQIRKSRAIRQGLITSGDAARLLREFRERNGRVAGRGEVLGSLEPETVTQYVTTLELTMRQLTVTVSGVHLLAGEKIRAKFDGKDVPLTVVAPTTTGGTQGTGGDADAVVCTPVVLTGADVTDLGGAFVATFVIPANVPSGTRLLVLYGNQANSGATWHSADPASGGYSVRGSLPYTSERGTRTTVSQTRTIQIIKEPIAQSLTFPAARMLSRVEIPLATKAVPGGPPLVFQIRGTQDSGKASTPTDEILASISREAAAVNVGPSSVNTFVPGDPVLTFPNAFRALMLRSASDAYQAYVAAIGEPNLATGGPITQQAIPGGIFMISANNVDWDNKQGWDLRCKVYVALMSTSVAMLYLARVSQTDITGFTLNVDQVLPDGTSIDWEYSVDSLALNAAGKRWQAFVPFVPVEVPPLADGSVGDTLDIRATLRTTDLHVMPGIHRRNLSVLVTTNATTAVYVSKRKLLSANAVSGGGAISISGQVEILDAPGGTHALYVSVDDGVTWRGPLLTGTLGTFTATGTLPDGFTKYDYTCPSSVFTSETQKQKLRLRLELTTPNKALRPRAHNLGGFAEPV